MSRNGGFEVFEGLVAGYIVGLFLYLMFAGAKWLAAGVRDAGYHAADWYNREYKHSPHYKKRHPGR